MPHSAFPGFGDLASYGLIKMISNSLRNPVPNMIVLQNLLGLLKGRWIWHGWAGTDCGQVISQDIRHDQGQYFRRSGLG